jgi:hypothetical protein
LSPMVEQRRCRFRHNVHRLRVHPLQHPPDSLQRMPPPSGSVTATFVGISSPSSRGLDAKGVWFLVEPKDGSEPTWQWICSPLEIVALTRGSGSEQWGRLANFKDPDGHEHEWAIPMELLADNGTIYRSRLLDMGLQIAPTVAARNALFEYIIRSEPPSRVRAVTRPGLLISRISF